MNRLYILLFFLFLLLCSPNSMAQGSRPYRPISAIRPSISTANAEAKTETVGVTSSSQGFHLLPEIKKDKKKEKKRVIMYPGVTFSPTR